MVSIFSLFTRSVVSAGISEPFLNLHLFPMLTSSFYWNSKFTLFCPWETPKYRHPGRPRRVPGKWLASCLCPPVVVFHACLCSFPGTCALCLLQPASLKQERWRWWNPLAGPGLRDLISAVFCVPTHHHRGTEVWESEGRWMSFEGCQQSICTSP